MDGGPLESGQNAESIESFLTAASMYAHPDQNWGLRPCVQPVELARDPHPGFIKVGHMGILHGIRNVRDGRSQIVGCAANHPDHGTRRQGNPIRIAQDPGGTQDRQHMVRSEIDDGGLYARAILRGGGNSFWETAPVHLSAGAAGFHDAMFDDLSCGGMPKTWRASNTWGSLKGLPQASQVVGKG